MGRLRIRSRTLTTSAASAHQYRNDAGRDTVALHARLVTEKARNRKTHRRVEFRARESGEERAGPAAWKAIERSRRSSMAKMVITPGSEPNPSQRTEIITTAARNEKKNPA